MAHTTTDSSSLIYNGANLKFFISMGVHTSPPHDSNIPHVQKISIPNSVKLKHGDITIQLAWTKCQTQNCNGYTSYINAISPSI